MKTIDPKHSMQHVIKVHKLYSWKSYLHMLFDNFEP